MARIERHTSRVSSAGRLNTLGAQGRGLDALLDELDKANEGRTSTNRTHVRWPFRHVSIQALLTQPDGGEVRLSLACRNLSVGGMSVLHNSFLHPGTVVVVDLPRATHGVTKTRGRIVRCAHVRGTIHEIGIKFDDLINLREFKQSDPFEAALAFENVRPQDLTGTILHIDPSQIDRQIVRHALRDSALSIRGCESVDEALPFIERGCDLILCEFNLVTQDAPTLALSLRADGYLQPIIVVSGNRSPAAMEMIRRSPIDVFLDKPVNSVQLLSAIAEFLAPDSRRQEQKPADMPGDLKDLAQAFASTLGDAADRLEQCMQAHDQDEVFRMATDLKGTALSLGFTKVGNIAGEVSDALGQGQPLETVGRIVRKLVMACRQSRHAA
ncbi:MAG: Hpt domain-containing protein [Phycisphaerales bacterium]|nr:Hpt domain-containing protein [Phycisphaerales bacterium]